jgi:hypothetical protein
MMTELVRMCKYLNVFPQALIGVQSSPPANPLGEPCDQGAEGAIFPENSQAPGPAGEAG